MDYSTYGRHILLDCYGVSQDTLNDLSLLSYYMVNALGQSGATIEEMSYKKFEPHGVSIVYLLSESHMTIHTYPEHGFCAIDCYTCGENVNPEIAISHMINMLNPADYAKRSFTRGLNKEIYSDYD